MGRGGDRALVGMRPTPLYCGGLAPAASYLKGRCVFVVGALARSLFERLSERLMAGKRAAAAAVANQLSIGMRCI